MKKELSKERRVINIPKEQFDIINAHCEANTLDMPKWMVKNSLEKIPNIDNIPDKSSPLHHLYAWQAEIDKKEIIECSKTYENVNEKFRFTKEFVCDVLFPKHDNGDFKFVKIKKHKMFVIKKKFGSIYSDKMEFGYLPVYENTLIKIKNAYMDICDNIQWGIQDNMEDNVLWIVYVLTPKDKSYFK